MGFTFRLILLFVYLNAAKFNFEFEGKKYERKGWNFSSLEFVFLHNKLEIIVLNTEQKKVFKSL
jgi:hypothetical protein